MIVARWKFFVSENLLLEFWKNWSKCFIMSMRVEYSYFFRHLLMYALSFFFFFFAIKTSRLNICLTCAGNSRSISASRCLPDGKLCHQRPWIWRRSPRADTAADVFYTGGTLAVFGIGNGEDEDRRMFGTLRCCLILDSGALPSLPFLLPSHLSEMFAFHLVHVKSRTIPLVPLVRLLPRGANGNAREIRIGRDRVSTRLFFSFLFYRTILCIRDISLYTWLSVCNTVYLYFCNLRNLCRETFTFSIKCFIFSRRSLDIRRNRRAFLRCNCSIKWYQHYRC